MFVSLVAFLAAGAVAGVLAGLLGVGGGIIIVPMLALILPLLDVPTPYVHHLALGTSLASIMLTSIASARAHNARGAVRWDIVKMITPGILIGTSLGGVIATYIPFMHLKTFFVIFLYFVSLQMLFGFKPKSSRHLPAFKGMTVVGSCIGMLSSFVGIGGGTMSVPFMGFCSVPMHTAVGTSAAIGFPIAVAGTLGYIIGGWGVPDLPAGTLGYVHLWAFMGIAVASFCTAPLGAKLAHSLPVQSLKRIFAIFLLCVATRMLWSLL